MKQLTVISGKGGTGKTSISAGFAVLEKNKIMVDCDVDAANLHLLFKHSNLRTVPFSSGHTPFIDKTKCTECGLCEKVCRFSAIDDFTVDKLACEGCAFCYRVCPSNAISMENNNSGTWMVSKTNHGFLVHSKLNPAEENSGKLVTFVRNEAVKMAKLNNNDLIIIDGPPGTGCSVIASMAGVDAVLIVTEPTLSGLHDLKRIVALADHFQIKSYVCVNKWDINEKIFNDIKIFCEENNKELIGKISFDPKVHQSLNKGITMAEIPGSAVAEEIKNLWNNLKYKLKEI